MRRVTILTLVFVNLLCSGFLLVQPLAEVSDSAALSSPDARSLNVSQPLPTSCCVSPPESSPPSIAYVANVSSLAYWQQLFATRVNETRLLGLLTQLASYNSRHPFNIDSNTSIEFITSYLTSHGLSYTNDWFSIPKATWTGSHYIYQQYWTRNLYVMPWGLNTSASSLVITCHLDSARHGILGMSTTNAPGANDNAAGIATALEVLDDLTQTSVSFRNWNVLFAFLGGEEGNGTLSLWGSNQLLSTGFSMLGINPSTCMVLNIDEIAYQGLIWPTRLAIYHYPTDDVAPLQTPFLNAGENLGIPLVDTLSPRAETIAEIRSDHGWCISEWTFYTNGIPSLTISTDQYPDPYKHTLYDGVSHCSLINLVNATKLIMGLIIDLAFTLPPSSPTNAGAWVPVFSQVANISVTSYLDPSLSTFDALVLDPLINIDAQFLSFLTKLSIPMVTLGQAGAHFLQNALSISFTTQGTQDLQAQGFSAFHPVIQSPWLLKEQDAQLFSNCSPVFAVTSTIDSLVLVGDTIWTSLGYFPPTSGLMPILFLGINLPETSTVAQIARQGVIWLLETNPVGICMGINQQNPPVGASPLLYVFLGDLTNWTGRPHQPIHLNISWFESNEVYQVVTNDTGVAQLELYLKTNTQYTIHAQSTEGQDAFYFLTPQPMCSANFEYAPIIQQGEHLSVFTFINSSWDVPVYVNLSLFADRVGSTEKTDLLIVPGENLIHLNMEILPSCPPQAYNLSFFISAYPLILLADQIPLIVQAAFILEIIELPENTLQNQLFPVTVNLTNLGSQTRAFDIIAAPNFSGFTQVIVQSNETRSITFQVQYLPGMILDTGVRPLSLTLLVGDEPILTVNSPLYVGYSTVNLIITLLPPAFIIGLCVLGIFWLRNGRRARQKSQATQPTIIAPGDQALQIHWGTATGESGQQRLPLNPQVMKQLAQVIHNLRLTNTGMNHYSNDRVVLAWEKKGTELHIVLQGADPHLVQRLFEVLSNTTLSPNREGDNHTP